MARKIYGVFSKGKFGLTTNKKTATDYVAKHGGMVRWLVDNGSESWDAPTFRAMSQVLDIQLKRINHNPSYDGGMVSVVFRKWKKGEDFGDQGIIALLVSLGYPEYTSRPGNVLSYEHVGQHGEANYSAVMIGTVPAKPKQYAALKNELTRIGYKLKVVKRMQR